jgi:hypothetical protein
VCYGHHGKLGCVGNNWLEESVEQELGEVFDVKKFSKSPVLNRCRFGFVCKAGDA